MSFGRHCVSYAQRDSLQLQSDIWRQEAELQLSFKEAVKIALENNMTLNQTKNQLAYTGINKTSSLLQMGPSVSASGSAYRNDGNSFNQNTGTVVNGVRDYVSGSISASVPLFNGFTQLNQYRQAANQHDAQLHAVQRSSQDVIQLVASQYLQCLLDQQLIMIQEENVALQRTQYNQIQAQVEQGVKADADRYNQVYQMKNAELQLVKANNALRNDKASLAQTLQLDFTVPFALQLVDWDVNEEVLDTMALENMYAVALQRRSDLKQAEFQENAAQFNYSAVKGNYFPSLYAGATLSSSYNYTHGYDQNRDFNDQFRKDNRQLSYGFSVSIPIYSGLASRSQVASARTSFENARLVRKNAEVTVKTEVLLAYQNFRDAIHSFEAASAQLSAAEVSFKLEKERYELQVSDIVQYTVANQAYVAAQADYQSARVTLMFQKILIDYATGTLSVEDIPAAENE